MLAQLKRPSKQTLAKYGLTLVEWEAIANRQGRVCAICRKLPISRVLCVDHKHVKDWKKMPPEKRKLFVRGLACAYCNRWLLHFALTAEKAYRAGGYLSAFDKRLAASGVLLPQPKKKAYPQKPIAPSQPPQVG